MADPTATIDKMFNKGGIVALCEREFATLKERITDNIRNKKQNSGHDLNVFLEPAATTGATEQSLGTVIEETGDGFSIAFVGASHLGALDKGKSPDELHQEFGSREAFYAAMAEWGRHKEQKYGHQPVLKGMDVWNQGTTLYQQGGGTETVRVEVEAAVERINEQLGEILDKSLYEFLQTNVNL